MVGTPHSIQAMATSRTRAAEQRWISHYQGGLLENCPHLRFLAACLDGYKPEETKR